VVTRLWIKTGVRVMALALRPAPRFEGQPSLGT